MGLHTIALGLLYSILPTDTIPEEPTRLTPRELETITNMILTEKQPTTVHYGELTGERYVLSLNTTEQYNRETLSYIIFSDSTTRLALTLIDENNNEIISLFDGYHDTPNGAADYQAHLKEVDWITKGKLLKHYLRNEADMNTAYNNDFQEVTKKNNELFINYIKNVLENK